MLTKKQVLADFRNFLWLMWKHLGLPDPTPVQYDIAEFFQWVTLGGGPERAITMAFRGVGKSWIRTAGTLWLGMINPDWKFFLPSAGQAKATDFSTFTKQVINTWDFLECLRSHPGQRYSNIGFDFGPAKPAQAPSVSSCGIGGQMTGGRADFIFPDDVEVPGNSYTQELRQKLFDACSEFEALITPGGKILMQGTPQTIESIYFRLVRERGYKARIWPSEVPTVDKVHIYGQMLAPIVMDRVIKGETTGLVDGTIVATDPRRFDEEELMKRRIGYGSQGYALQFLLDTSLTDQAKYPLKTQDLIVMPCDRTQASTSVIWSNGVDLRVRDVMNPGFHGDAFYGPFRVGSTFVPYSQKIMTIDPSGRGTDETSYVIMGEHAGYLSCLDFGATQGGYEIETLTKLATLAKEYEVNLVRIEDNFGDGMYTELFRPILKKIWKCGLEGFKVHGQKELRIIDTLEPALGSHRIIVDLGALKKDSKDENSLMFQLTHITRNRRALVHDDRIDALASAVMYFRDHLSKIAEAEEQKLLERQREEDLKKFLKNAQCFPNKPMDKIGKSWSNWTMPIKK